MSKNPNEDDLSDEIEIIDEVEGDQKSEQPVTGKSGPHGTESLQADLEKAKNDYLYLRAEFDNFRKNSIKERSELLKFGVERMAKDLLDVADTFDLAFETEITPDNMASFVKGMEMTSTNLKSVLGKFGITEVECLGQQFDPTLHEALSQEPTDQYKPGHICRVFKKAYKLHDRLLRPAQVVVATAPTSSGSEGDSD